MAGCKYTVGGQDNVALDEVLKYVEGTPSGRMQGKVIDILTFHDILIEDETEIPNPQTGRNGGLIIQDALSDERLKTIDSINIGAREYFGAGNDLLRTRDMGGATLVTVDTKVLNAMKADPDAAYRSSQPEVTPGQAVVEEVQAAPELDERDSTYLQEQRKIMKRTTEMVVVNLRKQISRLEKLPDTDQTKKTLAEMEVLRREIKRIKLDEANLDDYMDFVDFVARKANKAERLMKKIAEEYNESATQEERAAALKELSELKKTIDAFYNDHNARSLIYNLTELIQELEDDPADIDETIILLQDSAMRMKAANEAFLSTGLEIQVDYLLEFAPPEINIELDQRIAGIKKNRRIDGLSRFDVRYIAARAKGMDAVLDLNIQQLQEKKIGRESILKEMRQTHRDRSAWSVYFSPAVYSRESSIQLFAEAVRKALVEANDKTLDFKYDILKPAFLTFKEWKTSTSNITEDNLERLYEDIIETITVSSLQNGERVDTEVLAFMQEFDMKKFNEAKASAFERMRRDYNFPEDVSEYDEYFKSDEGKAYLAATVEWYKENTEAIADAKTIVQELFNQRDEVYREIERLRPQGHSDQLSALYVQYNDLKYQLLKSYRNGQYIGKLSKPKMSKYRNAKYFSMPKEARAYYDVLLEQYKKDQKQLGRSALLRNAWDDFSYVLPSVRKNGYERLTEDGIINTVADLSGDAVRVRETDTEFGQLLDANGDRIRMIPQYFTNMVSAKDVSKDITNSAIKFHDMSNRYKAKSDILGVVIMMESAMQSRRRLTMSPSGSFVMDEAARREGYTDEQFAAEESVASGSYNQVKSFIDNVIYGMNEQESIESTFDRISKNKIANSVVALTAYSTLSFNWLQAGNQLLLDRMSGLQEGVAGDYYSLKDLAWARAKTSLLGGGLGSILNDKLLPKFGKKNKLAAFLEWSDAFQTFGNEYGKEAGSAFKKKMTRDTMMIFQGLAEGMTVADRALAMAHATKGKLLDKNGNVILNKNGEPAHLYDLVTENSQGKIELDPRVANFNKAKFVARLHGMMKRTNQLKGSFDRVQAQRSAFGKLFTLFRNYLVPGLRKRFGNFDGAMIDIEMAAVNEGYYVTVFNQLVNAALDIKEGKIAGAIGRIRPGIFKRSKSLTERDQANIRRAYFEIVASSVMMIMANMLIDYMDDEDEESYMGWYMAYQLLRLSNEWSQFRSPALFEVIQDPTAVANPVIHLAEALHQSMQHVGWWMGVPSVEEKDVFYQRRYGKWEKGDAKAIKEWLDFVPTWRGPAKSMDPKEASKYYRMMND